MVRRLEGLSSSTAAISSATSTMLVDSSLPALLAAGAPESSCATCTLAQLLKAMLSVTMTKLE